jgi:phospholipid/cholesterol/gamma-HCH transport system substrate-binding protein
MKSFSKLAEGLNTFIAPPDGAATTRPANLHVTMAKLDRAMDAVNAILGDKDSQDNIKGAFAGMKAAADATRQTMKEMHALASEARASVGKITTRATATATRFDKLAGRLVEDADHLGKLLMALSKAADKLSTDEGTVGKLLTDPKLYNDLLETTGQLKAALTTLRELLQQWKAGGLTIRMK